MSTFAVPQIPSPPDTEDVKVLREYVQQLANITAMAMKELDWLINGNISSQNTREIAGYNISSTELKHKSGIVGMSGYDASNPLAVRFWSGNANKSIAPWRVQQNGKMYATDGEFTGTITGSTITGGTIQTAASGNRIVISNNSLKTYNGANLNGFAWGTDVAGPTFGDAFLYHAGNKLVDFYDNITNFSIKASGSDGIIFGGGTGPTYANGTWNMSGTFTVHSGTAFDTVAQANTSGLTLAQLETELNTLKGNLRAMNILA